MSQLTTTDPLPLDYGAPATTDNVASRAGVTMAGKLRELFGIDLRSLAAFRIALGVIVLLDLACRLPNLTAFYTDAGVLPRWPLLQEHLSPYNISIHLISGQAWMQAVLFAVHAVFAIAMVAGFRSRLATGLTWFMLISLQARNPMILHGGDVLLRMLLFWAMFLPTGARWSLDVVTRRHRRGAALYVAPATFALMLQVSVMYVISAFYKSDPIWRDGYAIFHALQIDQFATPLGHWLLNFPTLLRGLTLFVWWTELLGPMLVFLPLFTGPIRVLMVLVFWGMHFGMGATLELGSFPWVCGTAWLAFLPGSVWDRIEAMHIAHRLHDRCLGVIACCRTAIERLYVTPRPKQPRVDGPLQPSLLNSILAMAFVLFVFLWNLHGYASQDYDAYFPREAANAVAGVTWVDQRWNMFSPRPLAEDGWYVIPGKLVNGLEIDVFKDGAGVDWAKPQYVSRTYSDTRWRKYMMNLWLAECAPHRLWYARYLTSRWNNTHEAGEKLETFRIVYMRQDTTPDGVRPEPTPVQIWEHWCFK